MFNFVKHHYFTSVNTIVNHETFVIYYICNVINFVTLLNDY